MQKNKWNKEERRITMTEELVTLETAELNHDLVGLSNRPIIHYNTYEEALEAGLQEALKLI